MNRFLLFTFGILIVCSGCAHLPAGHNNVKRTIREILEEEHIPIEKCIFAEDPEGTISKVTFSNPRTGMMVTLQIKPLAFPPPDNTTWPPDNALVLAVTRMKMEVTILAVDKDGNPVSGAQILDAGNKVLGVTTFDGVFLLPTHDEEMTEVNVVADGYERANPWFSPRQSHVVVILHENGPIEWSQAMESIRSGCRDLHNAYGFFGYHGCKEAVPFLIARLERERPAEGEQLIICTAMHCLNALQMQTGKDFGWDAAAWRHWWDNEGKKLPESYFNARRRCEERERRWKQQHEAHAKEPLPESEDQKTEEAATIAP